MKSPVRLSALAAGVFACTLAALPVPASARQNQHAPIDVPAGDIKIHGHWVIDVRNPDGTSAARREFDNALSAGGRAHLVGLLLRSFSPSYLYVRLDSSLAVGPCQGLNFSGGVFGPDGCYVVHESFNSAIFLSAAAFPTLTLSLAGPGESQLVLAGHITVRSAGQIDRVATIQPGCPNTFTPASCRVIGTGNILTSHDLRDQQGASAPIPVAPGQIVQVKVTLSFCGSEGCQS